jgi:nitrite reductase/ring-hydroxylating ferredoxin subunit
MKCDIFFLLTSFKGGRMAEHYNETNSSMTGKTGSATTFRRRTILAMLLCLPTALFLQLSYIAKAFLTPVTNRGKYGGLIDTGNIDLLPQAGDPPRLIAAGRFWLVHENSGIIALRHSCTHLDCLFHYDENVGVFVCPCHGSEFSRAGYVLKGPANRPLDRYPIQLITADGQQLRVSDINTGAATPIADLIIKGNPISADSSESLPEQQLLHLLVDTSIRITVPQG